MDTFKDKITFDRMEAKRRLSVEGVVAASAAATLFRAAGGARRRGRILRP
jgi:hypothetical protein